MMIIPAKFQPFNSTGIGRKWGNRRTFDITPFSRNSVNHNENSKLLAKNIVLNTFL